MPETTTLGKEQAVTLELASPGLPSFEYARPATPAEVVDLLLQHGGEAQVFMGGTDIFVQMVNWAKLPVGNCFAAHYHEDMEEIFVIVHGVARMVVGEETAILRHGDTVLVAAREVHQMWNHGEEDVEYLVVGIAAGTGGQTVVVDQASST